MKPRYKIDDCGDEIYLDGALSQYAIDDADGNTVAFIVARQGDKEFAEKLVNLLNCPRDCQGEQKQLF